jgi:hypothetical protein
LQPAHLASGGILKAWAFENVTDTTRVAKMAKSRDTTKERYWRGVIQRFAASGLRYGNSATGKVCPSTASIGGGELCGGAVHAKTDVPGAAGGVAGFVTAAASRANRLSFPLVSRCLSEGRSTTLVRVLAALDAPAGSSGEP